MMYIWLYGSPDGSWFPSIQLIRSIPQLFLQHIEPRNLINDASPAQFQKLSPSPERPIPRKSGTGQFIPNGLWLLSTAAPQKALGGRKKAIMMMTPAATRRI